MQACIALISGSALTQMIASQNEDIDTSEEAWGLCQRLFSTSAPFEGLMDVRYSVDTLLAPALRSKETQRLASPRSEDDGRDRPRPSPLHLAPPQSGRLPHMATSTNCRSWQRHIQSCCRSPITRASTLHSGRR